MIIIKWYPSFLYQSCTFILYPLKTHRPIRKCKLPLIFKDGLQELYLPPKMHCGLECTHAVLLGGSVWSTHAAERSACWKYGQTFTLFTLILMLSPPTVLTSSAASCSSVPPIDTTPLPVVLWSGSWPLSAGHYQAKTILWSLFPLELAKTKVTL